MTALHDHVLPIFRIAITPPSFIGREMDTDASLSSGPSSVLYMKGSTHLRKLAKVRAAISEWAARYNLTDPWILETVVQTLLLWMANPE